MSTIAETAANHHLELQPGLERLGRVEEKFMGAPIPLYEPLESGVGDAVFISKSYDATSHFETTTGEFPPRFLPSAGSFEEMAFARRPRAARRGSCRGWTLGVSGNERADGMQTTCRTFTGGRKGSRWSWKGSGKDSRS